MTENIFLPEHVTEESNSLFLQHKKGLFDSINKKHPELTVLYKKMKSLDWDESEFNFSSCLADFQTCSADVKDIMIKTLAWQWEADSVAAHNLLPITAPFISSSELWAAWSLIASNEVLHALTYSEIVRNSFEHPDEIMFSILEEKQSLLRLETVMRELNKIYLVSHRLSLGEIDPDSDEAYDAIFLFSIINLMLERIQFMSSFAITFAIADSGLFVPIGQAVQKICIDELQVHVQVNKYIIKNELKTPRGQESFICQRKIIKALLNEVTQCELDWSRYLFKDGRELVGFNLAKLEEWVLYNANDVYKFLSIENPFTVIEQNPLRFIAEWIDINSIQVSPQEGRGGNYLLSSVVDDLKDDVLTIDF